MNGFDLLNEIGDIDEKYLPKNNKQIKKFPLKKLLISAACLCLAVFAGFEIKNYYSDIHTVPPGQTITDNNNNYPVGSGVTTPKIENTTLENDSQACYIAMFFYNGGAYYVLDKSKNPENLKGEFLSDITMFGTNSPGKIYRAKGYDENMVVYLESKFIKSLFINQNNLTFTYGKDLFEEVLHLSNYTSLTYETRDSWFNDKEEIKVYQNCKDEKVTAFIKALGEAPFMYIKDVPLKSENNIYDDREIYHLYFLKDDGVTIELRLFEGGYVSLNGFLDICVKMPEDIFKGLTENL